MKKIALTLLATMVLGVGTSAYINAKTDKPTIPMLISEQTANLKTSTLEKAKYLHEKGMFDGISKDEFIPALEMDTDGEQAIKIIGHALGWQVEDLKETIFKDISDWAVPYVEYARLTGVTNGISADQFGAEVVDTKRVITWLLASAEMDKDDVWKNTEKYAEKYEIPMIKKEKITRGDLVDIIYAVSKENSKLAEYKKELGYESKYVLIKNGKYKIPAIITIPVGTDKYPVVIGLHGTASNKDEAGGGYSMLAPKLAKAGIGFVRFDFIGTGDSKVDYVEYNLKTAVSDTNTVINYVKEMPNVDVEKIGLLGWSQGGSIALLTAAENNEVKSLVTWAGATDLAKNMISEEGYETAKKQGYSIMEFDWRTPLHLGLNWYEDVKATNILDEFSKSDASVLAINGSKDDVVDKANATNIVKTSKNKKSKELIIEDAGHTFEIFSGDLSKYNELSQATIDWFKEMFEIK